MLKVITDEGTSRVWASPAIPGTPPRRLCNAGIDGIEHIWSVGYSSILD